jgi:hypothetical protein
VAFEFAAGSPQFTSAQPQPCYALTSNLASHAKNDFKRPASCHAVDAEKTLCDSVPLKPPNSVTLTKIKEINLFGRPASKSCAKAHFLKIQYDLRS